MRKFKFRYLSYFVLIIVTIISILSCGDEKSDNIEFNIVRYDKLLFELDTNNIKNEFDVILNRLAG
jgi:hypothetical protein